MQEAKVAVIKAHNGYCIVHSQPDNDDVAKTAIFGVKKGGEISVKPFVVSPYLCNLQLNISQNLCESYTESW